MRMDTQDALLRFFDRREYHLLAFERRLGIVYSRLAIIRLLLFFGGLIATAVLALRDPVYGAFSLLFFGGLFVFAALRHQRCARSLKRSELMRDLNRRQRARILLDWDELDAPALARASADHPFDNDLDLSGERSLLHLIDTSVSDGGSRRLAAWLQAPDVDLEASRRRQRLVRELKPLTHLRNRLNLDARLVSSKRLNGEEISQWFAHNQMEEIPAAALWGGRLLSVATIAALIALFSGVENQLWYGLALAQIFLALFMQKKIKRCFTSGRELHDRLRALRGLFKRLESFNYSGKTELAELCRPFYTDPRPARLIEQLDGVLNAISVRENVVVFGILNGLFPWDISAARRLREVQLNIGANIDDWMDRLYQIEALASLANFAWLHPAAHFPDLLDASGEPVIQAEALGHVLIKREQRVANDVDISGTGTIIVLTGSNMSGKSTFLRTIGINLALAYAGAPVMARSMRCTPLRMFTCIRVGDSVLDGISSFYAEVRRLRALLSALDAEHPYPLLYFIDEIFRGTNNRERLIGSKSTIAALIDKPGLGLVTTHDLELTSLETLSSKIHNFHFREHIADGRMHFDYTLRPGPCPTTNALEIMRQEGLPVEFEVD